MSQQNIEWFFDKKGKWQATFQTLRELVLECSLVEELKWGCPCYTYQGKNIVLIHGFKDYCALLFMQGALLSDPEKILIQQTKNVQAARQIRFSKQAEIQQQASLIKAYIQEAIKNEEAGLRMPKKPTTEYELPSEFRSALSEMPELKTAFYTLTPGRQRGYLLYFSSAKQSKTRTERVEKYIPKILDLKGLED